jgi:hypothetical protein
MWFLSFGIGSSSGGRSVLISRWWWPVFGRSIPAGATPMPLRPMRTQSLPPWMTWPSCGQMMYSLAPGGEDVFWAWAAVIPSAVAQAIRANLRSIGEPPRYSWLE